jgi:hypothetical protein
MVQAHIDEGYDVCMCTDHDKVTADPGVGGILFIPGCEETCTGDTTQHLTTGNVTAQQASTDTQTVIDAVPYAALAHPWHATIKYSLAEILALARYAAIEIEPGEALAPLGWDDLLTAGRQVHGLLVDDAHDVGSVGNRWVVIFAEATIAGVIAALITGRYYSTEGPTLDIDDTACRLRITANVACNWAFIGTGGATLHSVTNSTVAQYAYQSGDGYVRAVATRVSDGTQAFTNAIMVP